MSHAVRNNPSKRDSRFRSGIGVLLVRGLFFEMAKDDELASKAPYTLEYYDTDRPSLYQLYMAMEDVTEYKFATTYLESYEHWKTLCQTTWFKPYLMQWREDLDLAIKAKATELIKQAMSNPNITANALNAAKYLLDKGYDHNQARNRKGRPAKESLDKMNSVIEYEEKRIKEDEARLKAIEEFNNPKPPKPEKALQLVKDWHLKL